MKPSEDPNLMGGIKAANIGGGGRGLMVTNNGGGMGPPGNVASPNPPTTLPLVQVSEILKTSKLHCVSEIEKKNSPTYPPTLTLHHRLSLSSVHSYQGLSNF
jgi:hypothetical protein